jgi:hypothetical protein
MKRWTTPQVCMVLMLSLGPSLAAAPQIEAPKPKISNEPLTPEQVAVYRAVLEDYTNGTNGTLNLANRTEPSEASDRACLKGKPDGAESHPIVHQLDSTLLLNRKFVLVDPGRQVEVIKENDPQKVIMNAIDDRKVPSTKQVNDSVKRAFDSVGSPDALVRG